MKRIARLPRPGTAVPTQLRFGPDEQRPHLSAQPRARTQPTPLRPQFVQDGSKPVEVRFDGVASSEEDLTLDEKLRRERARDVSLGVTSATWADEGDVLLVPLPAGVFVLRGLAAAAAGALDVAPSKDSSLSAPKTPVQLKTPSSHRTARNSRSSATVTSTLPTRPPRKHRSFA